VSDSDPDLLRAAGDRLNRLERANIRFLRRTFSSPSLSALLGAGQRTLGAGWVYYCTRNLAEAHGLERLPPPESLDRYILVANHRSYFDLFVLSMMLIRNGYRRRMLYPVRSGFFYDHPLGLFVNGTMSFFSMYPPIFRERNRAALNIASLADVAHFVRSGGFALGIHPEGTRNKGEDPYALLPAQSGVGRLIYDAPAVAVIPAFINGLGNHLPTQVAGNFNGRGGRVIAVFGAPIPLADLHAEPASGRTYKKIAERTLEHIARLGEEERALRASEGVRDGP